MESGRKDEVWLVTFFVLFVNNALPVDKDSIATVLVFVKDIYIYYIKFRSYALKNKKC